MGPRNDKGRLRRSAEGRVHDAGACAPDIRGAARRPARRKGGLPHPPVSRCHERQTTSPVRVARGNENLNAANFRGVGVVRTGR